MLIGDIVKEISISDYIKHHPFAEAKKIHTKKC